MLSKSISLILIVLTSHLFKSGKERINSELIDLWTGKNMELCLKVIARLWFSLFAIVSGGRSGQEETGILRFCRYKNTSWALLSLGKVSPKT